MLSGRAPRSSSKGFQVKEGLMADDRATCARLWLLEEKTRKNGEKAYLVGNSICE